MPVTLVYRIVGMLYRIQLLFSVDEQRMFRLLKTIKSEIKEVQNKVNHGIKRLDGIQDAQMNTQLFRKTSLS